jgi:hypothetical protein
VAALQDHLTSEPKPRSLASQLRCSLNLVSASRSLVPIQPRAHPVISQVCGMRSSSFCWARNFPAMSERAPNHPAIHPQRRTGDCGSQRTGDVSHERRDLLRLSEALDERGGPDLCEEFSLEVRK